MDTNRAATSASDAEREQQEARMKISHPPKTVWQWIGLAIYIGTCLGAFWFGWRYSDDGYHARILSTRVWQLAFMLRGYHHEHGAFPPTKHQPVVGGPVHSWRVLVVNSDHFDALDYDLSQEWNSPHNLRIMGEYWVFVTRSDNGINTVLAIGEDDEWPSEKPLRAFMAEHGKDRFLLVEYPDSQVHWMEPKY